MAKKSVSETIKPSVFFITPMEMIKKWYSDIDKLSIEKGVRKTWNDYHSAMVNLSKNAIGKGVPFNQNAKEFFKTFTSKLKNKVPQEKAVFHKELPVGKDVLGQYVASATYHIDENKNSNNLTYSISHTFDNPFVRRMSRERREKIIERLRKKGYID